MSSGEERCVTILKTAARETSLSKARFDIINHNLTPCKAAGSVRCLWNIIEIVQSHLKGRKQYVEIDGN